MIVAVEKETQLEVWLEENMPEPGGGNPNYVETVTGTLANPWGAFNPKELANDVTENNANVYITITVAGKSATFMMDFTIIEIEGEPDTWMARVSACFLSSSTVEAYQAIWGSAGLSSFYIAAGTTPDTLNIDDLTEAGESFSTILTIIHHPLPDLVTITTPSGET